MNNSDFLILAVSQSTSRSMWGKLPVTEFYACLSISSKLQLSSETYVHSVQDICNSRIPLNIAFRRLRSTSRKTTIRLVMSVSAPTPPPPARWSIRMEQLGFTWTGMLFTFLLGTFNKIYLSYSSLIKIGQKQTLYVRTFVHLCQYIAVYAISTRNRPQQERSKKQMI